MANIDIIKIKRGFTAGAEPAGLTLGEIAVNLADGQIFVGGTFGNAIPCGGGGGGGSSPIATHSVTGVASFNYDFVLGSTGHVGLTGNLVRSVNGMTGDVILSGLPSVSPLATSSLTGVASFGYGLSVSATGNVSITGSYVSSFNGVTGAIGYSPRLATSSLTGVASFGYGLDVSALGSVSLTSSYVGAVNGFTGPVTIAQGSNVTISSVGGTITINSSGVGGSTPPPLATSSLTGVASFGYGLSVSATGNVSLTGSYVSSFNGVTGAIEYSPRLATSSLTGVASFGYGLNVSALGGVSLTSSYVGSFNGATGAIEYSPRLATTSLTGVASFNSTYFGVDAAGAVSLASGYQVTGDTVVAGGRIDVSRSGNTVTVSNGIPVATSSVTGVASFGYGLAVSALGAVSLTSSYVTSFNGVTGPIGYSPRLATSSLTGVASFHSTDFAIGSTGHVTLGTTVAKTNTSNAFSSSQSFSAGLSSHSLYVSQGATFASSVQFNGTVSLGDSSSDFTAYPSGQRIYAETLETTSVSTVTVAAQPLYVFSCGDILIQAERHDGAGMTIASQSVRMMVVGNPATGTASFVQYANVYDASLVASFTVDVADLGGFYNWRVRATPSSSDPTRFRMFSVVFPTAGGFGL